MRRYSVLNRRQDCTWIRRQMPIVFAEFSLKERKKLSYPITAIEDAYKMDPDGFKNTAALDTGMEEEPTHDSVTRASKKNRKKQSGGKKKRSKKRG
uniref:Uncharacterized protein n=1 Tax=Panagrolaimus davidi TaxID=227884 RepID=A0A914Q2U7_9BILA